MWVWVLYMYVAFLRRWGNQDDCMLRSNSVTPVQLVGCIAPLETSKMLGLKVTVRGVRDEGGEGYIVVCCPRVDVRNALDRIFA